MWSRYVIFFIAAASASDENISALSGDELNKVDVSNMGAKDPNNHTDEIDCKECDNNCTISRNNFITILLKLSSNELRKVENNVKNNYGLSDADIIAVEKAFNSTSAEYIDALRSNLKQIMEDNKFNKSEEYFTEFVDLAKYLLKKTVQYNLEKIKGKLLVRTNWRKQILGEKILKQQYKIVNNYIKTYICEEMSICERKFKYSEYVQEWIRYLMRHSNFNLKKFFSNVSEVLQTYKYIIKSNLKLNKNVIHIVNSNAIVQRDTLDFIDEVISERDSIIDLVPPALKNIAGLLNNLIELIDDTYDLNYANEKKLNKISEILKEFLQTNKQEYKKPLELIINNFALNFKIWPIAAQSKMDLIWSKIILL